MFTCKLRVEHVDVSLLCQDLCCSLIDCSSALCVLLCCSKQLLVLVRQLQLQGSQCCTVLLLCGFGLGGEVSQGQLQLAVGISTRGLRCAELCCQGCYLDLGLSVGSLCGSLQDTQIALVESQKLSLLV